MDERFQSSGPGAAGDRNEEEVNTDRRAGDGIIAESESEVKPQPRVFSLRGLCWDLSEPRKGRTSLLPRAVLASTQDGLPHGLLPGKVRRKEEENGGRRKASLRNCGA